MSNFNELILSNFKKAQSEQLKNYPIAKSKLWQQHNNKGNRFNKIDLEKLSSFRSNKVHLFQGNLAFDNKRTTFTFLVDTFIELGFEFVLCFSIQIENSLQKLNWSFGKLIVGGCSRFPFGQSMTEWS